MNNANNDIYIILKKVMKIFIAYIRILGGLHWYNYWCSPIVSTGPGVKFKNSYLGTVLTNHVHILDISTLHTPQERRVFIHCSCIVDITFLLTRYFVAYLSWANPPINSVYTNHL